MGVVIDGAYQAIVLRWFYPVEAPRYDLFFTHSAPEPSSSLRARLGAISSRQRTATG